MRYYWTDERYEITYSKRVTHAVKMVDSCSRENGVLCTVAWSWLLFLHDESKRKNWNQILLEALMNCTKHFDLSSSLTEAVSQDLWFVECADYIFLDWFARSYLSMNVCLKLTMGDFVCVFDAWRKWSGSFVFGQGGIHIPSLACLFDFVIWDEWLQR